jgi:hypothetical protein
VVKRWAHRGAGGGGCLVGDSRSRGDHGIGRGGNDGYPIGDGQANGSEVELRCKDREIETFNRCDLVRFGLIRCNSAVASKADPFFETCDVLPVACCGKKRGA